MKFKKIWIIMIVLIILLTMGVVSASDNVTEDTLTLNEDLDDSKLYLDNDESIALDNEESDNDEIIGFEEDNNSIPISDSSLIEFRADDVVYGEEVEINVILPEEATGSVKIGVSNNNYTLVLSDGKCSVKIPNLSAGTYNCSVDYSGDGNFYPALEYHSFNVLKKTSLIAITCGDVHVGEDITVDIFTNRDFGNVTFLVGEKYYGPITIENRTGSMHIAGLAAGTYNITAIIAGNENYTDNVTTISVSILKYDSGLAVAVSDGLWGDNITIEVTGPVDATGILNVVIDDKNYVGELTGGKYELVYVPSKAGYYIVVVTYSGDEKYNFCNISMLLSISKRNSTVCITMNDSTFVRGTDIEIFIENNTETIVTLNGKELVIKDGKAVIDTTSLLPGNYTITATTVENDQYNANMAEMTFEIIYGNTFEDLQLLIDNCLDSTFTLTQDYYSTGNPITINKSITIDGQGHSLDGNNVSGIFIITAKVTIKNIDIINGNSLEFAAIYSRTDLNVVNSYFANNTGYKGGAIHMKDGNVTNCTFDGNSATDESGAIWINKGSVTNCNFVDNTAGEIGGSVCFYGEGSVSNCNFTGNTAIYGGAVYFQSTGTVANCNFTNNSAGMGGAIHTGSGSVSNCNFTDNSATYYGGAVYLSGTGNVTNCNFTGNTANNGGAIRMYSGTVSNCNFAGNTAGDCGGAISMSSVTVSNCNFTGNSARNGGAVYFYDYGGSVSNCNFAGNTANVEGGAVYFFNTGSVSNCNFTNNKATGDYARGGAIFFLNTGNVSNCNFTDNTAYGDGGAVYFFGQGNVTNCNFTDNTASRDVGGVYFLDQGTVTNCNFTNNKATGDYAHGGAIRFGSTGTVSNCNFVNNTATVDGGAVFFLSTSTGTVSNCNFTGNTATGDYSYGGAIRMFSGTVTNCNFTDNSARNGGAIWFEREYSIINCTFEGNSEPDIYPLPISDGIITNSTYKYYFKNGYLVDEVQEGATLDFRGLFLGNFTVIINKPVNIISSTADAVFDAGDTFKGNDVNSFSIVDGASSTKVTNLTLINTCLFINGASNVTVQNMTIVANKSGVGSGLGMVAIHTGAFYVTFKNSYIENGGTGEPVLVIGKGGQFVSIDNNIVNITGSSGNILSSNRFIGTGENPQSVYYTNNVINSHVGESTMMYGIAVIGEGNLIENNILNNFKGNGIVNAWGSTSTNNIYRNNIITGGGSMTIATYSVAENNNISSAVTVNEGSTVVANMVNGLTVNGKDSFIVNNFINGDVTIAAAATNTTLMDNVIFGNVIVNSNQNTLIDNTITSNNEYTIDLKSTRGNYLYGNGLIAVSSNGDSSIKSEDNYNEILDNYPYEADLIVFVEDIPVGEMAKINISINPAATGLVKINVSGRNYSKEIQNGNVYMEISDLTADDYNVTVAYDGNEFVSNSTFNKVFTVFKLDPSMVISVRDISYGENEFVNVTIAKDVEINNLTFSLFKGGKSVSNATSIIENGASSYNFSNLDFGAYILEIKYVGDLKYLESLKTVRFTVSPVITILTEVVIEDNMKISMSLGDANGRITIYLDDELYLIQPFVNGKFSSEFSTAGFSLGNHYISFADAGNNLESNIFNYWDVKTNTYLPIKYAFNVLPQHFTVPDKLGSNDDGIVILSFPTDAKGTLSVFIDGVKYKVFEITGGILKIDLSKYKDGNYKFTFKYSGDKKYSSFTKDSSAKLHNTLPVKIVAGNAKVLYSSAKKYSVTVYSNSGKKLSGVKVTFLINGKTLKTVKTNSKGVASVVVSKKPGSYKITSKTSKAKTTKTLKVTHVLSLKKVKVKRSAKKLVLKATLKKVNGKYIKGKKITFKFNGKKYTAKTNKKGVAKVTIKKKVLKKLKKGKKVKYQATYLKDTVKKSVKIKK